jgi:hypothetical protein
MRVLTFTNQQKKNKEGRQKTVIIIHFSPQQYNFVRTKGGNGTEKYEHPRNVLKSKHY